MSIEVSFYIPVFNGEKTIQNCLDSILNQSVKVNEIIVINDASKDNTKNILEKYSSVKIIENENNKGLGYCRNIGIKNSKNNIVASIDADVVLDKFWLEILLNEITRNDIKMCGGNMIEKLINNEYNLWRAKHYSQNWGNKDLLNPPFLYGCNTIQTKELWNRIGGYNENCTTNGEDMEYSAKVRQQSNANLYYSSKAKCYHLQNDDLQTLSERVWRYHSLGYKIKKPSTIRFLKLSVKQLKFLLIRIFKDIRKLDFKDFRLNMMVFFNFVKLEFLNTFNTKIK